MLSDINYEKTFKKIKEATNMTAFKDVCRIVARLTLIISELNREIIAI